MKTVTRHELTRRDFMRNAAVLGTTAGLVHLIPTIPTAALQAAEAPPKRGGTLTVGIHEDLFSVDPFRVTTLGDTLFSGLVSQPLVAGNAKDEFDPVLAESFRTEDGGKTWTFRLRRGVTFHNGRELTANEVKWSLDRVLDSKSGAWLNSVFRAIDLKTSIVDRYTVKAELSNGFGAFLGHLATLTRAAIIHPDSAGPDGSIVKPIGTGPFQFVEWKPGAEIRVRRHEQYWQRGDDRRPLPYLDAVTLRIVPDATTRLNALMANEVDYITQPPLSEVKKWVDGRPPTGIAFRKWFHNWSDYFSLNTRRAPFSDLRVREAVRYAIDREELNEAVYFGLGEVHNQPFKKSSHWYVDVPMVRPDLGRARQLMREAGLASGVDVTFVVYMPSMAKHGEIFQAQLARIGIRARLDRVDIGPFVRRIPSYDWDVATLLIGTILHPDRPYGYLASNHGLHANVGGYDSSALDALVVQARNEVNIAKARALYKSILEIFVEDQGTPLYCMNVPLVHAFREYVRGFDAYGYDLVSLNAAVGLHKTWVSK